MTNEADKRGISIRDSILQVVERIRQTANSRRKTELPTADFSHAINSVGELFVDLLLQKERNGRWWLGDDGAWIECQIKASGRRCLRNFIRGQSAEWEWFPQTATRLADPMTGPDHVATVTVPSLSISAHVALEQKLRFGTPQDAFAKSSTYVKHLLAGVGYPPPGPKDFDIDSYCHGLLEATKAIICKTTKDGRLAYSGSVPHVCFVSLQLSPHKIIVQEKIEGVTTQCDFVGFLPPSVNEAEFLVDSPHRRLVQRAKVRLWLGLDSLIEQCDTEEVEAAWDTALKGLDAAIRNPRWST